MPWSRQANRRVPNTGEGLTSQRPSTEQHRDRLRQQDHRTVRRNVRTWKGRRGLTKEGSSHRKKKCPDVEREARTDEGSFKGKVVHRGQTGVCRGRGLLAIPKNQDLDFFLWKLTNFVDDYFWFGLSDEEREGEWMRADGTVADVTGFRSPYSWANWLPGEPDASAFGGLEDCALYNRGIIGWDDAMCHHPQKFICQLTQLCPEKSIGSEYRGTLSVAISGKTCQRWDTNSPHDHEKYWPWTNPDLTENYCRNPERRELSVWCYTTDPRTHWEYCTNPLCLI
uniref:C-type lectin domain-containing protein n=1 Tax=Branchiostoma floridae TaxID=7739 RepID=C3ZQC2_BRAFL|eukprot:XP_002589167.1 hypothetical protein BRAFLDRAFT_84939 [Branchiostoma floridae]